jgi:hypothetical protein
MLEMSAELMRKEEADKQRRMEWWDKQASIGKRETTEEEEK